MTITIDSDAERFLREQASRLGLPNASALVEKLVEEYRHREVAATRATEFGEASAVVRKMRGSATRPVTTDELLAQTRSEV